MDDRGCGGGWGSMYYISAREGSSLPNMYITPANPPHSAQLADWRVLDLPPVGDKGLGGGCGV